MTGGRRSRAGTVRGLAALAVLAAVTAGLPAVLCLSAASPLPGAFPGLQQAAPALASPGGGTLFLSAARDAAWIAWAAWTLSAAAEVYVQASGRPVRLAGLGGSRVLVAAVLIGFGSAGPAVLAPAPASAVTVAAAAPPHTAAGPAAASPSGAVEAGAPGAALVAPAVAPGAVPQGAPGQEEVLVFAGGLLSGAVLVALARLRRRQRQDRGPGRRIALPAGPGARRAERAARSSDAPVAQAAMAGAALAALAGGLRRGGQRLPPAAGLHLTPAGDVDVLLTAPAPDPPAPFAAVPGTGGMCWRLTAAAAAVLPPGTGGGSMLPGLVSAGRTPGGGQLLVDLEAAGVTAVGDGGDGALAGQFLAAAVAELALNPWAGRFDLVLDDSPALAAASTRACACAGLDEAIRLLEDRGRSLPAGPPAGGARAARLADPCSPDWDLTLLAARTVPSPAQMARILAAARPGSGIAALVPAPPGGPAAPAAITLRRDPADGHVAGAVLPPGLAVTPPLLGDGAARALDGLLGAALAPDVGPADPPYDEVPVPSAPDSPAPAPAAAGAGGDSGLSVCVLGPLAITGPARALQDKHAELVTALALAGERGLTGETLRGRLGPDEDTPKPPDSLRQVISRTRRELGTDPSGTRWILHGADGRYRLHPAAVLDWHQFSALAAAGRSARDPGPLRDALTLLRGEPLSGLYWYWIDPALPEAIRAEVTDAAALLSALEADAGDPAAAARAARAGLAVDSTDEQLWRALMRAEDAAANTAGVHAVWKQCLAAIAGIAPDGEPHPATTALYRDLTARRGRAPAGRGGAPAQKAAAATAAARQDGRT